MTDNVKVEPMDKFNEALAANAHPDDWVNPEPDGRYNMVVIGAGTAGLVTAAGVAGLGGKVALIERHLMGGDCLNYGCVPSKCIIRSSRQAHAVRNAGDFGVRVPDGVEVDFAAVMQRMRRIRSRISRHGAAQRFGDKGIDIFLGQGRFVGPGRVEVAGSTLEYARACIATGARAHVPPVDGLEEAGYLTNETVFSLTERPRRLAVIGGGPIGCELGQAFARLGCEVTICQRGGQLLSREEPDVSAILAKAMESDGVNLRLHSTVSRVERRDGEKVVHMDSPHRQYTVAVDEILVALGRAPNVEALGLDTVGVQYDTRSGVTVDDRLRTTNPRIYAAGDVCMKDKFTHAADAAARIVIQNALFFGRKKLSALTIPWCTYTDPEIARVGLSPAEAAEAGIEVQTFTETFDDLDRAMADGETSGLARIHVCRGSDRIVGATIVASHAGEMISEITLAMVAGAGLGTLGGVIHPYPTQAEVIKHLADAYRRTTLGPKLAAVLRKVLTWRR